MWKILITILLFSCALSLCSIDNKMIAPAAWGAEVEKDTFYGLGFMTGGRFQSDPLWHVASHRHNEYQLMPIYGLHMTSRWDIWGEGKIGYLDWGKEGDALKVGALAMTSYDVLKYNSWSLFGEAGGGIGYRSYSPANHTLGVGPLGFIDYGLGVKYKIRQTIIKIGLRFEHSSSIPKSDTGINTYGIGIAILR